VVSNWTAVAQTYVNNLHMFCPRQYSYAYDEVAGGALQTCPTGANFTITFCPGGSSGPPPPTNLALGRPTLSSSNETSDLTPNLAVDGNGGTRWSSAFSDPQWIRVDLGASHTINRVVLRWEAAFGRAYQIQTSSDGNTWTTMNPLQTARTSEELMASPDGSLLFAVMGGDATFFTGVPLPQTVEIYNIAGNSWTYGNPVVATAAAPSGGLRNHRIPAIQGLAIEQGDPAGIGGQFCR